MAPSVAHWARAEPVIGAVVVELDMIQTTHHLETVHLAQVAQVVGPMQIGKVVQEPPGQLLFTL
jgi:hypothetical protein